MITNSAVVITYKGSKFGSGHYFRSSEILRELKSKKIAVDLVLVDDSRSTLTSMNWKRGTAVIIDVPFAVQLDFAQQLKNRDFFALDWTIRDCPPIKNFVAFQNSNYIYPSKIRTLYGSEYLIIPSLELEKESKRILSDFSDTILMIGSNPSENAMHSALKFAERLGGTVTILGSTRINNSSNLLSITYAGLVNNPYSYLMNAKYAITNGGISMLQSLMSGIKTYCFPQNINEELFVKNFIHKKSDVNILSGHRNDLKIVASQPRNALLFKKHFDYHGAQRIVESIMSASCFRGPHAK